MATNEHVFTGFPNSTIQFLSDLRANNNKIWFEANKQNYLNSVLAPLQNLVVDLGDFMLSIDPQIEVTPAINKTISRIYRDTRFSKDKSPYKSNMWITFKRPSKQWKDAPAYFFEISPDTYSFGMGFYSASKETMDKLREVIDTKPSEFFESISFLANQAIFTVEGDKYKRALDPSKSGELVEWYQRKNLYLICTRKIDNRLFEPEFVVDLIKGYGLLAPFYNFLWKIKN